MRRVIRRAGGARHGGDEPLIGARIGYAGCIVVDPGVWVYVLTATGFRHIAVDIDAKILTLLVEVRVVDVADSRIIG